MNPTLSVIMPVYNSEQWLEKSLGAICHEHRGQIIIVNDGSTDGSWSIIEAFAATYPNLLAFRLPENRGANAAADFGFKFATSRYIFNTASDDFVLPGFFEKSLLLLKRYPEAGLCCTVGDWRELDTGLRWFMGNRMADKPCYLPPSDVEKLERAGRLFICSHSVIVRRDLIPNRFPPALKYAADWYTYNLIAMDRGMCVVPEPLAVCQIRSTGYYSTGIRDREANTQLMRKIITMLCEHGGPAVERMRASGALYIWGHPMLRQLLTGPVKDWTFLTWPFFWKCLAHGFKRMVKNHAPVKWLNGLCRVMATRNAK